MIPDKLYIGTVTVSSNSSSEEHLLPDWHLRPNPKIANEEFIRKDALIEWAKGNLQEACDEESVPFEYYENGIITGKISAFEQVIDKLNSM